MSTYATEAVILRSRDFAEADRVVTLYTLAAGKVAAKVRGARRPGSRLGGVTMPLTHVDVALWRGRSSLESLVQVSPRDGFAPLRGDLRRMAYASLAVELVDLLTEERSPSPETYVALLEALTLVAYGEGPEVAAYSLAFRLLRSGGVLRLDCLPAGPGGDPDPVRLRPDTLAVLRQLLDAGPRALAALRLGPECHRQVRLALWDSLRAHLDRPPRSLAFLDTLEPLA